ncbi:hypothetical protein PYCCODRAFT_1446853 [Trametes coccinea BRFM310]|uniref:Uncharacterized protein n=1 Tax=Trametes coccinea (strain BRFM310) TaxID=1353009 RepID=A0A1Y2IFW3_TRAC3|nr:hypothetical protein PYCCODRAFT_1446853 [Trametes coccinea BRFM310]
MAYQYYQTSLPGWGTSQFQFGTPWAPSFQPQPSWGGLDFYNAHAVSPDPSLYNSVMARAPEFGAMGIGHRHARHWHRLLYSGLTSLTQALPNDIGAAAAYEMYRAWKHNSFLYEPLSADRTQQREGLIGMAIAEATRLWQYSGRPMDTYGQRAACEAAAAVASVLADRLISYIGGYGGGLRAGGSPYMSGGALPYANSPIGGSPAMMGTPLASGSHYLGSSPGTLSAMASPYAASAALPGTYSPYGTGLGASNTRTLPPGSTVVIERPRSRHSYRHGRHHHHHHHHRRRARSVDVVREGAGYGAYGAGGYEGMPYGGGYGGYDGYGGGYDGYGSAYSGYAGGGYAGGHGRYGGYGGHRGPLGGIANNLAAGIGARLNATGFGYGARY